MMAGTRPVRRVRRAAPLPNSVRGSAAIRTSGTVVTPLVRKIWRRREMLARGPRAGPRQAAALQTRARTRARWAESLAGCGHTCACAPRQGAGQTPAPRPGGSRARRHGCGELAVVDGEGHGVLEHDGQLDVLVLGGRLDVLELGGELGGVVHGMRRGALELDG